MLFPDAPRARRRFPWLRVLLLTALAAGALLAS
jgi:hypothetical protein